MHKNFPLIPEHFTSGSSIKIYWNCPLGHTYKSSIKSRHRGRGCPYCTGQKVCLDNCLINLFPEIAKEWHPTKNGILSPNNVTKGSRKKVWWLCNKGHDYEQLVKARTGKGAGCPYCSNQKFSIENSLAALFPNLVKEWHPTKNGKLTAYDITKATHKEIWWLCPKGHEYMAACSSRTSGRNCPYCSGRKVCKDNSLADLFPSIAKEWHPSKNGKLLPKNMIGGSGKKVWWLCPNGHTYQAVIRSRTKNKTGCMECYKSQKHP